MKKTLLTFAAAALTLAGCGQGPTGAGGGEGAARQQIRIVGSSTVYPFTVAVAERFAQGSGHPAPIVESTGTGGGLQLFCAGVGAQHPDLTNASRRIKPSEVEQCNRNGVDQIIEFPVGIDGLALIESSGQPSGFQFTVRDIYAALAANPFGRPQAARTWRDVNPALPNVPIRVYGPPPTSGTRDSFVELMLEKGCDSDPETAALKESDPDRHRSICTQIREDGAFIEAGENDNLLMQRVAGNPGSVGILGYSFLEENRDRVRGIPVGGIAPSDATIQDGTYPGARQMFVYLKGEHLNAIRGLREFLQEYLRGSAEGGYLAARGLIASSPEMRERAQQAIENPQPITAAGLQ